MALAVVVASSSGVACNVDTTMYPSGDGFHTGSIHITVTSGVTPYSYQWTRNGLPYSTSKNLDYLPEGTYQVTVTDSAGTTAQLSSPVTLAQPSTLVPNQVIVAPTCNGGNGTVTLTPSGGTSPYTYLWSDSTTTNVLTAPSGQYSVVITDGHGCGMTFTYIIPVTPVPDLEIQSANVDSQLVLTAEFSCSGGTVVWSTGATTRSIEAEPDTTYVVTLTCDTGCTATATISTGDQDDSYWCCLVSKLSDEATADFNGEKACDCREGLILMNLIGVYERNVGNTHCLTQKQLDLIISRLNEACCNCG